MTISAPRSDEQMDRFNEECAVFGVFAPDDSPIYSPLLAYMPCSIEGKKQLAW